ncbi:MAG: hypothetical protein RLZZ44_329 [Bacteroidota bacterium]|jgi:hypothetical protein
MDQKQLENDKQHLISWITQIQDHHLIEKIKSLMSASNEKLHLTKEQLTILEAEQGKDISATKDSDSLPIDLKSDYDL